MKVLTFGVSEVRPERAGRPKAAKTRPILNDVLDTPWRYECPFCGSTTVHVRHKYHSYKRYKEVETSMHQQKPSEPKNFICHQCHEVFDKPYDKKVEKQTDVQLPSRFRTQTKKQTRWQK